MRFADPVYFFLLILIIPMLFVGSSGGGRIRFSSLSTLKLATAGVRFHPRMILLVLRILCFILFVLAISRPQSGKKFVEVTSEGVDIILAMDTSGSMQGLDFNLKGKRVNRLEMVKKVVGEFIKKRPGDRMGLVVFGSEAFTQCPLTLDHGILMDFIKDMKIGMAGQATAIGQALGTAVSRMKDLKAKSKIIILLTDGQNTAGKISPLKAAELSNTFGIKVYTIGVGSNGPVPVEQDTIFGKRLVYQNFPLDEATLRTVANTSGGKYYRATQTKELKEIYDEIDKLEKSEVKVKQYTEYNELFHWYLFPAILLLLLEIVLANTRLRKIP